MSKLDSLTIIKDAWNSAGYSLFERAMIISEEYYKAGMDLASTAAFIGATPTELDSLLTLSELDDSLLQKVSDVRPPKTSWMMLASANDDEIIAAVDALANKMPSTGCTHGSSIDERLYSAMIHVAGPTSEQLLASASHEMLSAMAERAAAYKAIPEKEIKFLNSVASSRKRGKILTQKQIKWLKDILNRMADGKTITRDGIDADQAFCDIALDILGR